MYVLVGNNKYCNTITNLSFAPEVDITGQSLPINEFKVDLYTEETISVGQWIELYDDLNQLWARYWIIYSDRITSSLVRIHAQSYLAKYDRKNLSKKFYDEDTLDDILFNQLNLDEGIVYLDESLENVKVTGYAPEQTLKERIQWLAFAVGAYVRTFFTDMIDILPLDDTEKIIPVNKTFWRPVLNNSDYVSDINVTKFSYEWTDEQPQSYEEYVYFENRDLFLKITRDVINLHRQTPANVPTTEINIDDMFFVNSDNVNVILNRLAFIYFKNQEVDADIINNHDFEPADLVTISLYPPDENSGITATGYLDSCDFSFGTMAKSRIHMVVQEISATTKLIINYFKGKNKLGKDVYQFPVDKVYTIPNPYLDQTSGQWRYVYYPENENATGRMQAGTNTNNQQYDDALIYDLKENVLTIISVTEISSMLDEQERIVTIE